jgi:hypothetical protein
MVEVPDGLEGKAGVHGRVTVQPVLPGRVSEDQSEHGEEVQQGEHGNDGHGCVTYDRRDAWSEHRDEHEVADGAERVSHRWGRSGLFGWDPASEEQGDQGDDGED